MGTLTITTTTQQDSRIVEAFGEKLQLGRNATGAEVRQYVVNHIADVVRRYELNKAAAEAVNSTSPIGIE